MGFPAVDGICCNFIGFKIIDGILIGYKWDISRILVGFTGIYLGLGM